MAQALPFAQPLPPMRKAAAAALERWPSLAIFQSLGRAAAL
jgi:hypothetical protein